MFWPEIRVLFRLIPVKLHGVQENLCQQSDSSISLVRYEFLLFFLLVSWHRYDVRERCPLLPPFPFDQTSKFSKTFSQPYRSK